MMSERGHLFRLVAVSAILLVLSSCSNGGDESYVASAIPGLADSLGCGADTDVFESLPDGFAISDIDQLALADVQAHQIGRQGAPGDPDSARRFAKIALAVKNGARLTLLIHTESQGNALMTWGDRNSSNLGFGVDITACDEPADGWSMYPGGLWVLEPAYVRLIVQSQAEEPTTLDLPVGTTCP